MEGGELIIWAATEIAATTIAASVPMLRVLIADVSTARPSGPSGAYYKSGSGIDRSRHASRLARSGHGLSVLDNTKAGGTVNSVSPDAASDKSILDLGTGRIMKTETIAVTFGAKNEDEREYEMQDLQGANYR